jgi:hypothetical protein
LVHVGGDVDNVVAWLKDQVWNCQSTDF